MATETTAPKIFISYSWKPTTNKQKVVRLAERLTSDGVHVILDDWDLKEGHDKYQFMEQMVNDPGVYRVLLICNKEYCDKANTKVGGVGIESLIVSDDIYSKSDQTKFIPIIFEYDKEGKACTPTFVKTRIFVDLSDDGIFEENYETLLRNIFNKPSSKRPPIGTPPAYIESDEPIFLPTAHKVATIKNALINEKRNSILFIQDYLDTFLLSLRDFEISDSGLTQDNFDEAVLKGINDLSVLRDDFLNFIDIYLTYSLDFSSESIHRFWERLLEYLLNAEKYSRRTIGYLKWDHFKFFAYELFLSFSSLLLRKERYVELAYMLHNPFFVEYKTTFAMMPYFALNNYVETLDEYRNKKYGMNRVSLTADTIKQRANSESNFAQLKNVDLLLYYISLVMPMQQQQSNWRWWFPLTSVYRSFNLSILPKTVSQKHFDKAKILFGVQSKDELITKAKETDQNPNKQFQHPYYNVPNLYAGLNIEDMCKVR